jgi:hypothetical protein
MCTLHLSIFFFMRKLQLYCTQICLSFCDIFHILRSFPTNSGSVEYDICIVTDLINALPGNSSVNLVRHAIKDEAVFPMSSAPSSGGTTGLCNPFLSKGSVYTLPRKGDVINNRDGVFREVCAERL